MTENAWLILLSAIVLLAALVGVFYSWQMLREARIDVAVAVELRPERLDLRVLGDGHVRSERNRLATQLALAAVAATSMTTTVLDVMPPWVRFVSRLLITAAVLLVFANSVLNARSRRAAVRLIEASRPEVIAPDPPEPVLPAPVDG